MPTSSSGIPNDRTTAAASAGWFAAMPSRADRLHVAAPSVDGEGGVVEGDFAGEPADAVVGDGEGGQTRAERRKAAKGGRRRKK